LQRSGQEATARKLGEAVHLIGHNQPLRALAGLPVQRTDLEAALLDFREAARLAGNDHSLQARAEAHRGRVLYLQGHFEQAREAYAKALKADSTRVDVYLWQGEMLLAEAVRLENDKPFVAQRKDRAVVKYREAATSLGAYLDHRGLRSVAVYRERGQAFAKLEQHPEAILDYTGALEAKPTGKERARLCLHRGQEYLAIPDPQRALVDFEEVLQLDPENPDAYLGRANAWVKLEDPYKAVVDADKAVKGNPKDPRLWLGAARVYALAAAHLHTKPAHAARETASRYQRQAEIRLRNAFQLVPADEQRACWQEYVLKDKALYPIGSRLYDLITRFGGANP
jgi:tetratricopeptide (TPR) repeat protein